MLIMGFRILHIDVVPYTSGVFSKINVVRLIKYTAENVDKNKSCFVILIFTEKETVLRLDKCIDQNKCKIIANMLEKQV